jgi:hypothetical protein
MTLYDILSDALRNHDRRDVSENYSNTVKLVRYTLYTPICIVTVVCGLLLLGLVSEYVMHGSTTNPWTGCPHESTSIAPKCIVEDAIVQG